MAHEIYELYGEVPETVMSGQTADITPYCLHEWYEWVKFRDSAVNFPEDKVVLGCYLGPSIDIGLALTAKRLKENGQVVHHSTYHALTEEEWQSKEERKARRVFDEAIERKLGPSVKPEDLDEDNLEMPTFEPYDDDDGGSIPSAKDAEKEPMPEVGDGYLNAEVLLQRGDQTKTAKVIGCKCDAFSNLSWIHAFIRYSSRMVKLPNIHPTSLPRTCGLNVICQEISICCWIPLSTTRKMAMLLSMLTNLSQSMVNSTSRRQQLVGAYVCSGRMALHHGRDWLTSKS
jgi:hypothetical protein